MEFRISTLTDLHQALQQKDISSVELITQAQKAAQADQQQLCAYIMFRDQAVVEAAESDRRRAHGTVRPLEGIPVAIKDNMVMTDEVTTAGSKILGNYRGVFTASAVQKLRDAGAIVIGKTNLDEFAMGSSTENSGFFPSHNPWNPEYTPGGSSGGSAVAVAAGHVPVALGSDTGGSIRQPASFCNVVGLKPTYGRVSRSGLIAMASSLDQIGPLTRSVMDAALLYELIAGRDEDDATTSSQPVESIRSNLSGDIKGLRIGLPSEFFGEGIEADVRSAMDAAIEVYKKLGAVVSQVSVPHAALGLATYYVIMPAEVSSNLARFDGIRYGLSVKEAQTLYDRYAASRDAGLGAEAKRRIMLGTYVLSAGYADAYYHQAIRVRELLREEFHQVFDQVDVLLTPTSPTQPFRLGDRVSDPIQMYLADLLTVPANLADIPAISIPAGMANGLPIGLQLMAKRWDERTLLRAAYAFEQATDWAHQHPLRDLSQVSKSDKL